MATKKNIRLNEQGITIMEVLIAMIILSLSLLLLLNMAMVALDGNDWSDRTTRATVLLQQKLEELRAQDDPADGADTASGISRSWTVTDVGHHLRRIDIQAQWEDVRAQAKSNSVTAYIQVIPD
jgi:Tfp pilus assembly protein PilV